MKLIPRLKRKVREHEVLSEYKLINKIILYLYRTFFDIKATIHDNRFSEFGLSAYVGRQGSGKSISLVEKLEQIRRDFPTVTIMTNFGYVHEDLPLTDWQQLIDCRNPDGIVFAIDEIQNEFDVYASRNFNMEILKVITQQRKQGIKVLATSQVFARVSKPLREQCFEVIECYTISGRWTYQRCFDADDYNLFVDSTSPEKQFKVPRKWRKNFVQSDTLRKKYDSYAVIETMKKLLEKDKPKK